MSAPGLLGWAVEALVASALLMLLVLTLRGPARRAFGPQLAYALWALPALRLLLPPLPEGWRGEALPVLPAPEPIVISLGQPVATLPVTAVHGGFAWPPVALALWLAGAAAFLLWHSAGYWRFRYRLLRNGMSVDRIGSVTVVESSAASGPVAFGVFDRVVAFPRDFTGRFDANERELALAHELSHHARRDLLANWAALGVLALHWFNPVAWRAFRAFRCDQELANDARVLAGRSRAERHVYACAIIKAAHGGAVSPACHLHTIADLKGRLRMLTRARPSRRRLAAGTTAVLALVTTGLLATASGTQAAAVVSERIGEAVGVELGEPQMPVVPDAPLPPVAPDARTPRKVERVVVVRDGRTTTYEGAEARAYAEAHPLPLPPVPPLPPIAGRVPPPLPPLPPTVLVNEGIARIITGPDGKPRIIMRRRGDPADMPEVTDRACRDGEGGGPRQLVLNQDRGGRRVLVVCRNRIDAAAAEGVALAARSGDIRRDALRSALEGLRSARAGIAANPGLSPDGRRKALEGLDEALAELTEDIAERN